MSNELVEAKILEFSNIIELSKSTQNGNVVLVGGCFDIVHYGHIEFLKKAKSQSNFLVIALESDEFIQKRKKRQPYHTQQQRAAVLSALRYTDVIIKLPFFTADIQYSQLVSEVKPAIIAVTEGDPYLVRKQEQAKKVGATVIEYPLVTSFSTTRIIDYATLSGNKSAYADEGTT